MEIDVEQLRTVINRLVDHIVTVRGVRRVDLGSDFYWDIDQSEAYDPTQKPTEIDLGSFSDDWDFLKNVREGKDLAAVQLAQVAPMLRRLGEQLGESLAAKGQS